MGDTKLPITERQHHITTKIVVVDDQSNEYPFDPALLLPSPSQIVRSDPTATEGTGAV